MIDVQAGDTVALPAGLPELAERAARAAIAAAGMDAGDRGLTVVLTGDGELADLNRRFRDSDGPTDVLAFEAESDFPEEVDEMAGYLGDVIVSLERAREQAAAAGKSFESEVALLVAHGTLHLLGYDHGTDEEQAVMWALQERAAGEAEQR